MDAEKKAQRKYKNLEAAAPQAATVAAVGDQVSGQYVTCAEAHDIAATLKLPPQEVGLALDHLDIRIKECQLGLFGYAPRKKVVGPSAKVDNSLSQAIRERLKEDRISCEACWRLALDHGVQRMEVAAACEALGIKVGCCQLGAF